MRICVPKECYPLERRVALLPPAVRLLAHRGHSLCVGRGAGAGIGVADEEYRAAGAEIVAEPGELYARAATRGRMPGLVIKLKAPLPEEFALMGPGVLFCMFHGEQNPQHLALARRRGLSVVAMERVVDAKRERLVEQCQLTGEAGVLCALTHSQKAPGDMTAVVLGYGNVSSGAVGMCARLGIRFKIIRRRQLGHLEEYLETADLLVNGIAWPARARRERRFLVTREQIRRASPRLVVLDLAVDDPSPIETVHPTTYASPWYLEEGRVHVAIYGYPGLFPVTSSRLYSERLLPLVALIADNGGLGHLTDRGPLGQAIARGIVRSRSPRRASGDVVAPRPLAGIECRLAS